MEAILKFNLPEDQQEFKDYQDGIKCKYLLHTWLQVMKKKVEYSSITAEEMLENLNIALLDDNIQIFS